MERELIFPGIVKYGMKDGKEQNKVRRVQEHLCLRGARIKVDGDFGPATRAALMQFRRQHFPTGNDKGIVDQKMWQALTLQMDLACRQIARGPSATLLKNSALIFHYAHNHLVYAPREVGGPNRGPWVRLYTEGPETLWCAGFVSFVLKQAFEGAPPLPFSLSCDVLGNVARDKGLFVPGSGVVRNKLTIPAGSVFLIRKNVGDWIHTGIVTGHVTTGPDRGVIHTIEGNTNDSGEREGYEVAARIRKVTSGIDFIIFKAA